MKENNNHKEPINKEYVSKSLASSQTKYTLSISTQN